MENLEIDLHKYAQWFLTKVWLNGGRMPISQTVLEQLTFVGKSKQVKQTKTLILNLTLYKNLLRMYYRPKSKCKAMKLWGETENEHS